MNICIKNKVEVVQQDHGTGNRIYRCRECGRQSKVLKDGQDLRDWFFNHICIIKGLRSEHE